MWQALFSKKNAPVTITVIVAALLLVAVWLWGRSAGKGKDFIKPIRLPQGGAGIPSGWSAYPVAATLHTAMSGWGTDEAAITGALSGLTPDQITAVYNEFNNQFGAEYPGCDLICWFREDLSGTDLDFVLSKFQGVV